MRWTRVRQQTTDARADGQAVWSWRPDAGAKFAKAITSLASDGGKKARSPGRARNKPLKPTAQGRPGILGYTCGSAACFFVARGPWVPAGARPSLRPLFNERQAAAKLGRDKRRESTRVMPINSSKSERDGPSPYEIYLRQRHA
jgi:hypothetical protein